jgi:phosphopantetheinyl transferase
VSYPPPLMSVTQWASKPPRRARRKSADGDISAEDTRRLRSRHARILAASLLPPGDWDIVADPDGRPLVQGGDGGRGPDLSISHSGEWVAAAVSEWGRVGIDIETNRPGRDARAIADSYFSGPERQAVTQEGETALLAFWCMREAIAKVTGGGVAAALAIDGSDLVGGRDAVCSGRFGPYPWMVAHRRRGRFQIALAWSPPRPHDGLPDLLSRVLDQALGVGDGTDRGFAPDVEIA